MKASFVLQRSSFCFPRTILFPSSHRQQKPALLQEDEYSETLHCDLCSDHRCPVRPRARPGIRKRLFYRELSFHGRSCSRTKRAQCSASLWRPAPSPRTSLSQSCRHVFQHFKLPAICEYVLFFQPPLPLKRNLLDRSLI